MSKTIKAARAGVGVCHCAASNMALASAIFPACDLEREGVAVDGMPIGLDLGALMAAHREAARDFA